MSYNIMGEANPPASDSSTDWAPRYQHVQYHHQEKLKYTASLLSSMVTARFLHEHHCSITPLSSVAHRSPFMAGLSQKLPYMVKAKGDWKTRVQSHMTLVLSRDS